MMSFKHKMVSTLAAAMIVAGTLMPFTARASEDGRRNTTLAVGALTGVLAYKHMWIPAGVAAIGTYAAYHNWQAQIDARHRRAAYYARLRSYRSGYYYGSRQGRWEVRHSRHYHRRHRR